MSGVCQAYQNKPSRLFLPFFSTPKFDTKKPVQQVHSRKTHQPIPLPVHSLKMSDAPAAPVTENGVSPVQESAVVEEVGFKVRITAPL